MGRDVDSRAFARALVPGLAGVDEAGRGPLAGPVVAAAVLLAPGQSIRGAGDSKALRPDRRVELAEHIRAEAVAWGIGRADPGEIDRINILQATLVAMSRALAALPGMPERLHVDGDRAPLLPGYRGMVATLVGGDRLCNAVGAASILAKVTRDAEMCALDRRYPGYGFAAHKGYATARHREALRRLGPCPAHRRSFAPVQLSLGISGPSA